MAKAAPWHAAAKLIHADPAGQLLAVKFPST
jgi:hypothetical protein